MKTFKHYFIDLLKIIAFGLFITWLVSCNSNKQQTINLMHQYGDSLGLAQKQYDMLQYRADLLTKNYIDSFPAKAFTLNQVSERADFKKMESAAYHKMTRERDMIQQEAMPKKLHLQLRMIYFKSIIDSLKIEIEK